MGYRCEQTSFGFRPLHDAAGWRASPRYPGAAALPGETQLKALWWAAAITAGEVVARRLVPSRSAGWLTAYSLLGVAALIDRAPNVRREGGSAALWIGIPLSLIGYPLGCALLGHKPNTPPAESPALELMALACIVAPAEELTWGRLVEPRLGIPATGALFAAKHVIVDGRWRRIAGLALFWFGLGLVRSFSPKGAGALHVMANASGVVLGHLKHADRF